jgi:hypothetical protein
MGLGIEMKIFFRNFTTLIFRDRFFQIVLGASLLINLAIWVFLYFKFAPLGSSENILPLHYNIYFGIDFVGEWKKVFVIPLVGIFFITINFLISDIVYLRDKIIGYFLVGTGLFVQLILSGAAFMVAMINQ